MTAGTILLGRYRLEHVIGAGGTGTVYSAVALPTGERVAVKVLHERASGERRIARVRRGALAAATLGHRHVVKVHDLVASREGAVLATELLEGVSLRAHLARSGPARGAWVARLARQILGALEHAHRAGVVHGDIKADNVFLVGDPAKPRVKVLDFGLVESTDKGADLHALAAMLYFALTEQRQHEGAASVRDLRPDVDPRLCDVIDRALAKDPSTRWQSAAEMARALRRARPRKRPAPAPIEVRVDVRRLWQLAVASAARLTLRRQEAWVLACAVVFAAGVAVGLLVA